MSQRQFKVYRKAGKRIAEGVIAANIRVYIERLCRLPLHKRIAFSLRILQRRNPHTGERVE